MGGFLVKTFWKFGRCELLCGFVNVVTYLAFDFFCRHLFLFIFVIAQGSI
jgi:hypothetical protein